MKNNSHQDLVSNQRNVYNVIYETNYRTWRKSYMDLTKLTAYEIIEHRPLPDLKSEGALLRHKKSGARVLLISNDDENKVFNIGFRTPTTNSTGVPHIMEHTVLCGSEKFPTKDPFVELVKGSLNTFLNAMTYPDKTVYPVASCNEKDFQNLMDVYMDAVLHPNIYKYEEIFRQEGWNYHLEEADGELSYNGVVYNEMKGAFSSPDGVLDRMILNSLFPDTTYANESGGDPDVIPELTYEEYLNFHRTYYHPSNSYIYLYGNICIGSLRNITDTVFPSEAPGILFKFIHFPAGLEAKMLKQLIFSVLRQYGHCKFPCSLNHIVGIICLVYTNTQLIRRGSCLNSSIDNTSVILFSLFRCQNKQAIAELIDCLLIHFLLHFHAILLCAISFCRFFAGRADSLK